jgi:hypothetical protein
MFYRSKPQIVEAIQWTGENFDEVSMFAPEKVQLIIPDKDVPGLKLELLAGARGDQGWVPVPLKSWLVHKVGDRTDIWPVDPEYFEDKYEPAP